MRNKHYINKWLNKPFPFYQNYKQKILIPICLSLLVMTGLIFLDFQNYKNFTNIVYYGLIIILISLIFSVLLPKLTPKMFDIDNWTVKKSIYFLYTTVITIAISIALIMFFFENSHSQSISYFFVLTLKRAIILSFLPIVILVFLSEIHLYRKKYLNANKILTELKNSKLNKHKNSIFVFAVNTKDEIEISENELLFIKAEANYCFLFFIKDNSIRKHLIRSSLKKIELTVSQSSQFIRCHKSYIVNLSKVSNVTGNARGYVFHINQSNHEIPVSRNISRSLISEIKVNS